MNKIFYVATLLIPSIDVMLVAESCETGWKSFENNCYKFVPEVGVNQHDALVACHKMGGASLASVHSAHEHVFILDKSDDNSSYWIGLTLVRTSAQDNTLVSCSWVDGSAYDYGACEHGNGDVPWQQGGAFNQPNNYDNKEENCVAVQKGGWNDLNCGETKDDKEVPHGYICKKKSGGNANGVSKPVHINIDIQV